MEKHATGIALLFLLAAALQFCFAMPQPPEQHELSQHQIDHQAMQGMQVMPGMENMPMAGSMEMGARSQAYLAKLEADKRFSEFNHRFAGIFVMLAGLLTLSEPLFVKRLGFVRYLWAFFFLMPGLYLFFFSDPEAWPFGQQTLHHVITVNHQVLQHKVFSLILLTLGVVEFLRVRYDLKSVWAMALFPALAASGAILLLFHAHPMPPGIAMDPEAMRSMNKVEHQHLGFATVGVGIALSKAATDWGRFNTRLARNIFAILLVTLGLLLLTYTE